VVLVERQLRLRRRRSFPGRCRITTAPSSWARTRLARVWFGPSSRSPKAPRCCSPSRTTTRQRAADPARLHQGLVLRLLFLAQTHAEQRRREELRVSAARCTAAQASRRTKSSKLPNRRSWSGVFNKHVGGPTASPPSYSERQAAASRGYGRRITTCWRASRTTCNRAPSPSPSPTRIGIATRSGYRATPRRILYARFRQEDQRPRAVCGRSGSAEGGGELAQGRTMLTEAQKVMAARRQ